MVFDTLTFRKCRTSEELKEKVKKDKKGVMVLLACIILFFCLIGSLFYFSFSGEINYEDGVETAFESIFIILIILTTIILIVILNIGIRVFLTKKEMEFKFRRN